MTGKTSERKQRMKHAQAKKRDALLLGETCSGGTECDEVLPPSPSWPSSHSDHLPSCLRVYSLPRRTPEHLTSAALKEEPFHSFCLLIKDTFLVQCVRTSKQPFILLTVTFSASPVASITCPTAFWLFCMQIFPSPYSQAPKQRGIYTPGQKKRKEKSLTPKIGFSFFRESLGSGIKVIKMKVQRWTSDPAKILTFSCKQRILKVDCTNISYWNCRK